MRRYPYHDTLPPPDANLMAVAYVIDGCVRDLEPVPTAKPPGLPTAPWFGHALQKARAKLAERALDVPALPSCFTAGLTTSSYFCAPDTEAESLCLCSIWADATGLDFVP